MSKKQWVVCSSGSHHLSQINVFSSDGVINLMSLSRTLRQWTLGDFIEKLLLEAGLVRAIGFKKQVDFMGPYDALASFLNR